MSLAPGSLSLECTIVGLVVLSHRSFFPNLLGPQSAARPLHQSIREWGGGSIQGPPPAWGSSHRSASKHSSPASVHWSQSQRRNAVWGLCNVEPQCPTGHHQQGAAQHRNHPSPKLAADWASKGQKKGWVSHALYLNFQAPNPTQGGSIQIPSQSRLASLPLRLW